MTSRAHRHSSSRRKYICSYRPPTNMSMGRNASESPQFRKWCLQLKISEIWPMDLIKRPLRFWLRDTLSIWRKSKRQLMWSDGLTECLSSWQPDSLNTRRTMLRLLKWAESSPCSPNLCSIWDDHSFCTLLMPHQMRANTTEVWFCVKTCQIHSSWSSPPSCSTTWRREMPSLFS